MTDIVRISPETFRTIYLRKENRNIVLTESGRRIWIQRIVPEEWTPQRIYEYEKQQNENKRNIQLIDKIYRNQVVEEFKRSLRS